MQSSLTHAIAVDGGEYIPGEKVQSGIQRLIAEFMKEYLSRYTTPPLDYYYFSNTPQKPLSSKAVSIHNLPRKFFSSIQLPYHIFRNKDAVFLGFSGVIPKFLDFFPLKKIVFVHDFGFSTYPDFYDNPRRMNAQVKSAVRRADLIITFTQQVRRELLTQYRFLNPRKVHSIYAGVDHLSKTLS